MKYSYYKNLVLAKTNGADIHDINGMLALIGRERMRANTSRYVDVAKEYLCKIGNKTGVWLEFDDLDMSEYKKG